MRARSMVAITMLIAASASAADTAITTLPALEQAALIDGHAEMALSSAAGGIKIKAIRRNPIAQTGCAFVAVHYIVPTPTEDAPGRIRVHEMVSPVCPADQAQAVKLGSAE